MIKKLLLNTLIGYKKHISPFLPPSCRYYPTCSEYMYQAVSKYGVLRGLGLGVFRLLRCNPFVNGGYDPVPGCDVLSAAPDDALPGGDMRKS